VVAAGLVVVLVFGTRGEVDDAPVQVPPEPGVSAHVEELSTPKEPAPLALEGRDVEREGGGTSPPPLAAALADPEPSRVPKKSQRAAEAAPRETKEQRRSKLIDPYQ
jgi:hypothetical protein